MSKNTTLYNILNSIQSCDTISDLANKLYLSQPYISRTIKDAEKEYDITLIHRKANPIRLTQAGELVLNNLRKVIETENELKYDLLPYQNTKDYQIKISMNQPLLETVGNEILPFLIKEYPNITFSFFEQTTNLAQEELLNNNIDIFIGKFLTNKDIKSQYITQTQLYLVVPDTSPAYKIESEVLKRTDLKTLDKLPYVSLTDNSFFQIMVDNMFSEYEIHPSKLIKVENSIAAINLAVKGYGFTIGMKSMSKKIAKTSNRRIKLIHIPSNFLELNIGISYLETTNSLIKEISNKLGAYLKNHSLSVQD